MDIVDESSGTQRGRGKNKCFWTNKEIDALIQSLQEMASDPLWKTDGGFKNGYMTELRKMIQGKIPDFTKQVDPHIDSKLKWLKNKYHAICEMLKESGCKCDTTEKVIRCEREWYDSWIKRHKEAKGLWNMKFPYLDDLEIVYGKDRAIGVAVEDFEDAINNLEAEESAKAAFVNVETDEELTSRKQKKQGFHVRKEAKKLKTSIPLPVEAQFEMVTNKFVASIDMISSHFSSIATAMTNEDKREQLAFDRSNSVVAELLQLGFSDVESSRAGDILTATPTKITVFYQLSAHARRQYIMNLLYPSAGSFSSSSY